MRPLPCLLALAVLVAGCGSSPNYYLLPPTEPAAPSAAAARTLAVAEVGLPSYAEAAEIALLGPDGVVSVDDDALWADEPRRAMTRHLIAALQTRLDAEIGGEPWPELERPELRLEVIADRMIAGPDGRLHFTGAYNIVAPESGRFVAADRFALAIPIRGEGYPALLAAHARALDTLADLLVPQLARLSGTS